MNEHEFDQCVRAALTADPSPAQQARLAEFWRRQSRAQRRRLLVRRAATVAASLAVLAIALGWLTSDRRRVEQPIAANSPAPRPAPPTDNPPPSPPTLADTSPAAAAGESPSAGREPTPYERAMFSIQVQQVAAADSSRLAAAIDEAIARLAADPPQALAELAVGSTFPSVAAERLLLDRLPQANEAQQRAIVQLLDEYGTQRSTPALLQVARQQSLRSEAITAVERIEGVAALADVAPQSGDGLVRRAIIERLLHADSEPALRAFLSLVSNPLLRDDALAAADASSATPTDKLLALLNDEDKAVRLAAARVLGYVNGPQVTAALIAIVTEEPAAPVEAWLALLACRGESADRFLAIASQHPRWLGHVNYARVTWARMTP